MSKNLIESLHSEVDENEGVLYFTINNRLLILKLEAPELNDSGQWRVADVSLSPEDYDPEENEVELSPLSTFVPVEISDKDFEFIETYFVMDDITEEEVNERVRKFEEKHDNITNISHGIHVILVEIMEEFILNN